MNDEDLDGGGVGCGAGIDCGRRFVLLGGADDDLSNLKFRVDRVVHELSLSRVKTHLEPTPSSSTCL